MHGIFEKFFTRYPNKSIRTLEIIPPLTAIVLVTLPFWGSILFPFYLAYFIIFFDVYWLYKSVNLAITSWIAAKKIHQAEKKDWLSEAKKLTDFNKVTHLIIIPSYKESREKLKLTLDSLKNQTFPRERLYVYLALEKREEGVVEKVRKLMEEYGNVFGGFYYTLHPDLPHEVKGKSSNQAFAADAAYKEIIVKRKININHMTVSSVDADVLYDKQFYSYLTHSFLTVKLPYYTFWQSATVTYNNFWQVPSFTRVISFFGNLWHASVLVQRARLIPHSTYSLSFKLLMDIENWDTDVIPEDYRIFFKAFFRTKGKVVVEPIFLKTTMDAAQSSSYVQSLMNKYHQERRWSWGISDDALYIKWYLTVKGVPFFRKTSLIINVLLDHILWPVNWFIITISANAVVILNPVFSRTSLGYSLPSLSGFILTLCLLALIVMIYVDYTMRSKSSFAKHSKLRQFLFPLEFLFMPIGGFLLSALPALITHIQLISGKRMEYKVTEKV